MARKARFIPPFTGPPAAPADWVVLFQKTLGVAAATIDSGANAWPGTSTNLRILINARCSQVGTGFNTCGFTYNGDTGNNYDAQVVVAAGTSVSAGSAVSSTVSCQINASAFGQLYDSYLTLEIYNYANTTTWKTGQFFNGSLGTGAGLPSFLMGSVGWRNTAAVNQFTLTADPGDTFVAGSTMVVYGF